MRRTERLELFYDKTVPRPTLTESTRVSHQFRHLFTVQVRASRRVGSCLLRLAIFVGGFGPGLTCQKLLEHAHGNQTRLFLHCLPSVHFFSPGCLGRFPLSFGCTKLRFSVRVWIYITNQLLNTTGLQVKSSTYSSRCNYVRVNEQRTYIH